MSNDDVNKLIVEALSANVARDVFEEQLLLDSTTAFARGRALQRRMRTAGLTFVILLVTTMGFVFGRLSVSSPVTNQQGAMQTIGEGDEHIKVSKDLVVWLDAARFFTRLGMNERAALSYQQASDLIPYDALPRSQQADIGTQDSYAAASEELSTTGSQLEDSFERTRSAVVLNDCWRETGYSYEMLSKITTQYFWRAEP